jgi:gliding motility-associated-like protein
MTVDVNAQSTPSFTPIADICSGEELTLPSTSTNAISGTWSPAVDNTTTTTYTFTPDGGQCATIETMTVDVNSIPEFNTSVFSDPTFCSGSDGSILIDGLNTLSTYDLTYNDGISNIGAFSITTDASGATILSGLEAGAYSTFLISDGNCSFTVVPSLNLTDPLAPEFVASGSVSPSICGGDDGEIILTGLLSNTSYSLSYLDDGVSIGPINISSDISGKIQISNLDAGIYSAFVLDLAGCTGSTPSSITLVDPSVPVLQITDPLAVCTPGIIDLSLADVTVGSTGGGTLTYWTDAAATTPLVDQSAVGTSGTYYIQSEINGCIDIEAVNVVVNQTPDVQITDPLAVCTPGTVDLSLADVTEGSTGGGTLTYWTDAVATIPLVDQSAIESSGTYYIQSEINGCMDIEAVNIVVNQTPSFTISGTDPSVCNAADGLISFTGLNPSSDYTLSYDSLAISSQTTPITSDASGNFILNGFVAGLYGAFSISLNDCAFTAPENIDLNNPLAPSVDLQLDTMVCDSYTLEAITGSNLSGAQAYYTQSNGSGVSLNPGDAITASQTIYVYDIIGACSDEASFTLTVNTTPQITNLSAQEACVNYILPVIEGTNLSGNENYYTDAQANGGTAITNPINTSQQVFIYDESGACSDEVSFDVMVYDLPEVLSFSGEGTYCEGDAIDPLNVEVNGVGQLNLDYTLDAVNNSATTNTTSITLGSASGVYVLTQITDAHCSNTTDFIQTIIVNATPATPSIYGDAQYCANEVAQDIEAYGSTGSYTWYADQDLMEVLGNEAQYTPETIMGSTSYYVTATENGCEGLPQMIIITFQECGIIIPTAFTPDGDQTNDTWRLENIDAIYPNNVVSIYNRLGNKVFEAQQGSYNQMPWDGTFNGQELPVASYYYIIEYNDNTTENSNGIVTLIK